MIKSTNNKNYEERRAILFIAVKHSKPNIINFNLSEMKELSLAANIQPIAHLSQNLKNTHPAFLIGEGKLRELELLIQEIKPHLVIFDHSLSGIQIRNLEKKLKITIMDRNQLILVIFAQRAQSYEGKLQIHLAQLLDQMPRMVGAWLDSLSRQGGGHRAKGPGEKALEVDRRIAKQTIKKIREKLEKVRRSRLQHRSFRKKRQVPSFALIGYTNSGKSSLLNVLTKSNIEVKNQVFMTLDPKTKKIFLPNLGQAVITDTVGFIRDLPTHLIEAFKATLEESAEADILVHVIDASNPRMDEHIKVVNQLIENFNWHDKTCIYVFNKCDLISLNRIPIPFHYSPRVFISTKTQYGIQNLIEEMTNAIKNLNKLVELYFPKEKESEIYRLSRETQIEKKEEGKWGTVCYALMNQNQISHWKEYISN